MASAIRMSVLGELRLTRNGAVVPLPASRKTRALLAYLALTGRPHRRERLCELFWDLPDDPRGSLRWSLSKMRRVLNDEDCSRIVADRERVALALSDVVLDLDEIRRAAADDAAPIRDLQAAAEALCQVPLDGLDLFSLPSYQAWLWAEREEALRLRPRVFRKITLHPSTTDHDAVKWLRLWHDCDPLSQDAAGMLVRTLTKVGRSEEAEAAERQFRNDMRAAGRPDEIDLSTESPAPDGADNTARRLLQHQSIGFCTADDGVRIAYATVGEGPPLVKAANWLNHLELDWNSPIWTETFQALAARHTFVRYDERGNGLSDWDVPELSLKAFVRDLETVVDTLGLERFPLLGMSQGCAVSIDYAVRHPERVSALILIGGYAAGWRIGTSQEEREQREAVMTLTRHGWGTSNAAYRHIFSQTFMPDAAPEELAWFDEFQRQTTSPENAARFQDAFGDIDVRVLLPEVRAPTLVLHARNDQRISLAQGRELATGIPGAQLVTFDSRSHIILGHEPAWQVLIDEIDRFLAEHDA